MALRNALATCHTHTHTHRAASAQAHQPGPVYPLACLHPYLAYTPLAVPMSRARASGGSAGATGQWARRAGRARPWSRRACMKARMLSGLWRVATTRVSLAARHSSACSEVSLVTAFSPPCQTSSITPLTSSCATASTLRPLPGPVPGSS
eukprot:scaffold42542_cov65-Phaeocystis_antarctica.AAC.4